MRSIAQVRQKLAQFDTYAKSKQGQTSAALQAKWRDLFDLEMSDASAKSFAKYYKTMSGGSAPLNYSMGPGVIGTYGRFPVEAGMDPASIKHMDVYYQDSLIKGCGVENTSLTVPVEMGSNQVGGKKRSLKKSKMAMKSKSRKSRKSRKAMKKSKKTRKMRKNYRGGDMLATLSSRPLAPVSTVPPSYGQNVSTMWDGTPAPISASPTVPGWHYVSNGTFGLIDPGMVTPIQPDMTKLASPPPWQTSN